MARIAHLSDLHFGEERFALVPRLIEQLCYLAPDMVVITGDLTQHSRVDEYEEACRFITALPMPVLAVPGNRDLSPWNIPRRLMWRFKRWTDYINPDITPVLDIKGVRVVGMNSTDPFALHRGRLKEAELERASGHLANAPKGAIRVVAMHHPFYHPSEVGRTTMLAGSNAALRLAEAGAEIVLCGHLHHRAAPPFALLEGQRRILNIESGSTLASTVNHTDNRFNLIELDKGSAKVTTYSCSSGSLTFAAVATNDFRKVAPSLGWLSSATPPAYAEKAVGRR